MGCDDRQLVKEAKVATVGASGVASASVVVRLVNPTSRLRCLLAIVPGSTAATALGIANSTWTVTPQVKRGDGFHHLQPVITDGVLPSGYEIESAVRHWAAEVDLTNVGPSGASGEVVAVATWEPAPGCCMSDAERSHWFAQCEVTIDGNAPGIQFQGGGG